MIKKGIASPGMYYYHVVAYAGAFIMMSIIALTTFDQYMKEGFQMIPWIAITIFWGIALVLNLFFFNRVIFINVLHDNSIQFGKIFDRNIVPLNDIKSITTFINKNYYRVEIGSRWYVCFAWEIDVKYLRNMIAKSQEVQAVQ